MMRHSALSYRLVYTQRAVRDINRLDAVSKSALARPSFASKTSLQYAESLTDPELGSYRFRIGDYRVIFDMESNDIVVLRVGHRKKSIKEIRASFGQR